MLPPARHKTMVRTLKCFVVCCMQEAGLQGVGAFSPDTLLCLIQQVAHDRQSRGARHALKTSDGLLSLDAHCGWLGCLFEQLCRCASSRRKDFKY
eukprot:4467989-Amphidinium_carterae.2